MILLFLLLVAAAFALGIVGAIAKGLFFLLIIAFTFFYARTTFNPAEVADNIKRYGGFVPGLRPGAPTARWYCGMP